MERDREIIFSVNSPRCRCKSQKNEVLECTLYLQYMPGYVIPNSMYHCKYHELHTINLLSLIY